LKGGRRGALAQCPISQTLAHLEDAGLQTSKDPCFYAHKNETCESPRVFLQSEVRYILFWIVIAAKLAVNFSSFARHVTTNVAWRNFGDLELSQQKQIV